VYYPDMPLDLAIPEAARREDQAIKTHAIIPEVVRLNQGMHANVHKMIAALGVEFRLLRAERSMVVLLPLTLFVSTLEVAFYPVRATGSYSAAYASITATSMLIFLIGFSVFYTGEAMHRETSAGRRYGRG